MRKFFVVGSWLCVWSLQLMAQSAGEVLPVAGEWRFALDRSDAGMTANWFAKNLPEKIQLPGILEAQGYGDEISTATPWVLSLYDHFWFLRADYAACTNSGRVKVPFVSQPTRHYLGAAWYQRDVEIPASWNGQRVVLFLERPHWKSTVWLDDREIGSDISLCTPHQFDFGLVPPGKHRLTVRVDNRMILPYRPDAHSISDSLDSAWNGIAGKMELRAMPPVWIENVQIFPQANLHNAAVRIEVGNQSRQPVAAKLSLTDTLMESLAIPGHWTQTNFHFEVSATGTVFAAEIALPAKIEAWDEFNPQLQMFTVALTTALFTNIQSQVIGLRNFRVEGEQFMLNGRPVYFRGTHFGGDFPLTGCPPTDVESWRKIFLTCKNHGLNHMRFHSWCPPEAAFAAADELGFYLQVECGMWNEFSPGGEMEKTLYAETARIIKAYGNHPSFLLLSASNEAHGRWRQVLPEWVAHFRAADPRRLYTPDTGLALIDSPAEKVNGGADYLAVGRIGNQYVRGKRGWFGEDYGSAVAEIGLPVIAHELGQWCAYPDFDVIRKFTGFVQPGNFEIFRDSAAAHGVLAQNHDFTHASGRFQLQCYKEEIEANLRTPGLAGFQLLELHDYTGQGTALVGLLDPFWESKGYVTPDEFKKFCNPVVPLARLKQRVFTTADKLEVPVEVANFAASPLAVAVAGWQILNTADEVMVEGQFSPTNLPLGKNLPLGTITASLAKFPAPAKYSLRVVVGQKSSVRPGLVGVLPSFINDWNFWLYPAVVTEANSSDVLETSSWDEAEKKLAGGGRVLFTPLAADLSWDSPPLDSVPVFWNRLMSPQWGRMLGLWCDTNHPALAEFPTEANCDWQWTQIIRGVRAMNLAGLPRSLRPVVAAIDDWNRNWKLGLIFEAKVGAGKLLVSAVDCRQPENPVAQQLRRSLLDYAGGDKFLPATEISPTQFRALSFDNLVMRKLGATAQADGENADAAIDGDPNTAWIVGTHGRAKNSPPPAKRPHTLTISFTNAVPMAGLVLLNRQNDRDHLGDVRGFEIQVTDDGGNWGKIAGGELASTWNPQTVKFSKTVTTRQIRLVALSGFGDDTASALAEVAVIYAGPKLPENNDEIVRYRRVRSTSTDVDEGGDESNGLRHGKKH